MLHIRTVTVRFMIESTTPFELGDEAIVDSVADALDNSVTQSQLDLLAEGMQADSISFEVDDDVKHSKAH